MHEESRIHEVLVSGWSAGHAGGSSSYERTSIVPVTIAAPTFLVDRAGR